VVTRAYGLKPTSECYLRAYLRVSRARNRPVQGDQPGDHIGDRQIGRELPALLPEFDDRGQHFLDARVDVKHLGAYGRLAMRRLDRHPDQDGQVVRIAGRPLRLQILEAHEPVHRATVRLLQGERGLADGALLDVAKQRQEQGFLALEEVVDRSFGEPRLRRDLFQACGRVSLPGEQAQGGPGDLLFGRLTALVGGHRARTPLRYGFTRRRACALARSRSCRSTRLPRVSHEGPSHCCRTARAQKPPTPPAIAPVTRASCRVPGPAAPI
jgi:hypothetical protein